MTKKLTNAFITLIFIMGLSLLIYPSFSNYWNQRHQTRAIAGYEEKVENLTDKQYQKLWNDATLYNTNLKQTLSSLNDQEKKLYESTLDVTGTGMMVMWKSLKSMSLFLYIMEQMLKSYRLR